LALSHISTFLGSGGIENIRKGMSGKLLRGVGTVRAFSQMFLEK